MSNTRLAVVVRKDLQLPAGLLAAQVAHIGDQWMRKRILQDYKPERDIIQEKGSFGCYSLIELDWMKEPYISVLAVNTKEELDDIWSCAKREVLQTYIWTDTIYSDILKKAIKVDVGISIGPDDFDKIKIVTGNLPLY